MIKIISIVALINLLPALTAAFFVPSLTENIPRTIEQWSTKSKKTRMASYSSIASASSTKRQIGWQLYNFLDDFKTSQEDGDGSEGLSDYPPPICPTEIHRIRFSTTAGDFTINLDRALSPSGVTRFLDLVDDGFFNEQYIYRVDPGFVIQFGVAQDPMKQSQWDPQAGAPVAPIPDEPNRQKFQAGSVSFAGNGVNARSCHIFIALEPGATYLGDALHETVLGNVEHEDGGMLVLEQLVRNREEQDYGNLLDLQGALIREGNSALDDYPGVDRIITCGRF
jgi:peptidyl-prolyl cis-trans isomerase A (cyclophilin A)